MRTEKESYEVPVMEVTVFETEDVITTSGFGGELEDGDFQYAKGKLCFYQEKALS